MKELLEASKKAREERKAAGLKATLTPFERLAANPSSRSLAIAAKCYDCMGQGHDRGWKAAIGNCGCRDCPLWSHRPYQGLAVNDCGTDDCPQDSEG